MRVAAASGCGVGPAGGCGLGGVASGRGVVGGGSLDIVGGWLGAGVGGWSVAVATAVGARALTRVAVGPERGEGVDVDGTDVGRWGAGVSVGVGAARTACGAAKLSSSQPTATRDDSRIKPA